MTSYIFIHPERDCRKFDDIIVYHDSFIGNEDPYIWRKRFLHSFCKITDYSYNKNDEDDTIFWVSIKNENNENKYVCDLVFKVDECEFWYDSMKKQREAIRNNEALNINSKVVENDCKALKYHFSLGEKDHSWSAKYNRRRVTLKATEDSFQPQTQERKLLDITGMLKEVLGTKFNELGKKTNYGYKPVELNKEQVKNLYCKINESSPIKLTGRELENLPVDRHK
ncbi:hypothetical protein NW133_01265 [Staphylococcus pettenkoferi]|uniref:Uncharacterized protein n=1 Tax=Staphylococcus pettenkoferi TaxID=170573 RepID=A0ABT4BHS5_9STAP|nr:hypothetical protein [Staphylococcus pettenkoferi]MCY1563607.1 hypothetical protein [Staphylococcus pettenkoferi]MCY1571080.1 hypothetical protein [Staphylococcus pettenkoferi]MCY1573254.1 hypothetical protein [Staphylococcus pettenkoferi]MCY1579417.1 hypothetical protein [Staphylococcus pettenkoferi]MCY1582179.1 hypothetical protein [Staphylococcus pettenkoferi]